MSSGRHFAHQTSKQRPKQQSKLTMLQSYEGILSIPLAGSQYAAEEVVARTIAHITLVSAGEVD